MSERIIFIFACPSTGLLGSCGFIFWSLRTEKSFGCRYFTDIPIGWSEVRTPDTIQMTETASEYARSKADSKQDLNRVLISITRTQQVCWKNASFLKCKLSLNKDVSSSQIIRKQHRKPFQFQNLTSFWPNDDLRDPIFRMTHFHAYFHHSSPL